MAITMYHNPRCSKSRQVLDILTGHGVEPVVTEYLKTPTSPAELRRILDLLGMEPRDLMWRNENEFSELGLDGNALSREDLIDSTVRHPVLIERPIVVKGDKAVSGRPPEHVLELL